MVQSIIDTPYDEEFARICIMTCFPDFDLHLERNPADPPDIVDKTRDIGIEVTRALSIQAGQLDDAFSEYMGKEKSCVPENLSKKINKNGYGLVYNKSNQKENGKAE